MKKIVVKIGGSNLKTAKDISRVIEALRIYGSPLVIVVSALYGVTDILIQALKKVRDARLPIDRFIETLNSIHYKVLNELVDDSRLESKAAGKLEKRLDELGKYLLGINCLGDIPEFAKDMILSYGERMASPLFEALLNDNGFECRELLPEQIGLQTVGDHGIATVDFDACENRLRKALAGPETFVIPGFYGVSPDARVVLFGRGGSDYSAAAIARCIGASSLDIWKDVAGFLSADPEIIDSPVTLKKLSYKEAAELSYFGARILHPRCVEPLIDRKIPIRILNIRSFTKKLTPFTVINNHNIIRGSVVKSVTFTDDIAVLKLVGPGVGSQPGIIADIAAELSRARINIKSIITAQTSINILLSKSDLKTSLKIAGALNLPSVRQISFLDTISLIAVVGEGLLKKPGIAARIFKAVSKNKINVLITSTGASEVSAYFIVNKKDKIKAIGSIHEEFFK